MRSAFEEYNTLKLCIESKSSKSNVRNHIVHERDSQKIVIAGNRTGLYTWYVW